MVTPAKLGDLKTKGILFGDDYWGIIIHEEVPYKNERGITMKKYLIVPSPLLVAAYPYLQKPGALNIKTQYGMGLWVEYPSSGVSDENTSRTNAIARIDYAFDGKETPQTRRYSEYNKRIEILEMENENLRIANLMLTDNLNHALGGNLLDLAIKMKNVYDVMGDKFGGKPEEEEPPSD